MKPLLIHEEAREELDDAVAFYEGRSEGLGLDLLAVIATALDRISRDPKQFPLHRRGPIRRHVIRQFPFTIFFRDFADRTSIVAFAHTSRRPGYWRRRSPL